MLEYFCCFLPVLNNIMQVEEDDVDLRGAAKQNFAASSATANKKRQQYAEKVLFNCYTNTAFLF